MNHASSILLSSTRHTPLAQRDSEPGKNTTIAIREQPAENAQADEGPFWPPILVLLAVFAAVIIRMAVVERRQKRELAEFTSNNSHNAPGSSAVAAGARNERNDEIQADELKTIVRAYAIEDYQRVFDECGKIVGRRGAVPVLCMLMLISLRRLGRDDEELSRTFLKNTFGPGAQLLMFNMVWDDHFDIPKFLEGIGGKRFFMGSEIEVSDELECQLHYYWGARLLTAGKLAEAAEPLRRAASYVESPCLEQYLASSDLARLPTDDRQP